MSLILFNDCLAYYHQSLSFSIYDAFTFPVNPVEIKEEFDVHHQASSTSQARYFVSQEIMYNLFLQSNILLN